jgi:nicotinamide-nucleotide amidase
MSISAAARRVARLLKAANRKVVFAESCTGGLASGALTKIPGISNYHCGGMVVYRNETKRAYLGISAAILAKPGPVSPVVARIMAERVLDKTSEADLAVSVTGHLGPHAPRKLDGRVYVGIARRDHGKKKHRTEVTVHPLRCRGDESRTARQRWVVEKTLSLLAEQLESEAGQ